MIKIENLNKSYFTDTLETQALQNINLDIEKGEFISIMGPSGCGKSTLLNMIGLIDQPTDGQIFINEMQLVSLPEKKLAEFRNMHLGFIFQSFHLISDLSVIDNVELPLLYRKVSAKKRREMAEQALEKVGLFTVKITTQISCQEDNVKGWLLPEQLLGSHQFYWPMNLQETLIVC